MIPNAFKQMYALFEVIVNKKFLFILFLSGTSFLFFSSLPSPLLNDFVHETHKKLHDFKSKEKRHRPAEDELDKTYLELLGFVPKPTLYPNCTFRNIKSPVIVTAATSDNYENSLNLLAATRIYLPNHTLVIYDLGLGSYETLKMKERCYPERSCILRHFDFSKFPPHLKSSMYTQAFLPFLLQLALTDYGSLLWAGMDTDEHFISNDLHSVLEQAERSKGLVGWALESQEPTSSYTHPAMFSKLDTLPRRFHFHKMMDSSHIYLVNTPTLHQHIMLPWIRCCLSWSCLSPMGAESGRTCMIRKPRYLYSGCHKYASSALNIVLGKFESNDDQPYLRTNKSELFGRTLNFKDAYFDPTVSSYLDKIDGRDV